MATPAGQNFRLNEATVSPKSFGCLGSSWCARRILGAQEILPRGEFRVDGKKTRFERQNSLWNPSCPGNCISVRFFIRALLFLLNLALFSRAQHRTVIPVAPAKQKAL